MIGIMRDVNWIRVQKAASLSFFVVATIALSSCGNAGSSLQVKQKIPKFVKDDADWERSPIGADGESVGVVTSSNLRISGSVGGIQERITSKSRSFIIEGGVSIEE